MPTTPTETDQLDDVVRLITRDVKLADGRAAISDDAVIAHAGAIDDVTDAARREKIAEDLMVLAGRVAAEDEQSDGAFDDVIVALCVLTAVALDDVTAAGALLASHVGEAKARDVVGAAVSGRVPVGAGGRVDGAASPLAALLKNRTGTGTGTAKKKQHRGDS